MRIPLCQVLDVFQFGDLHDGVNRGIDYTTYQPFCPFWCDIPYAYPDTIDLTPHDHDASGDPAIVVPLRLRAGDARLSFISTITVFGTPVDVTLSELAIETFFPADAATSDFLRGR
ncbi:MAG TPA: hypothetical protein PK228_15115 [Saprospiraceae bacterium]|nr:hypothetical protein [Saprospiraceae bacterium]